MSGRLGLAVGSQHYTLGFHNTATLGTIAAAAACARLVHATERQTAVILGIAATQSAGLRAQFGSDVKPLHAAWRRRPPSLPHSSRWQAFTASRTTCWTAFYRLIAPVSTAGKTYLRLGRAVADYLARSGIQTLSDLRRHAVSAADAARALRQGGCKRAIARMY